MQTDSSVISAMRVREETYVLKDGDTFLVSNARGDLGGQSDGLIRHGTRVLSRFQVRLAGAAPTVLTARVERSGVLFTAHLTNPALHHVRGGAAPGALVDQGVIHLERSRLIWRDTLYERLVITNRAATAVQFPIVYDIGSDFHDLFEVRGRHRARRGDVRPAEVAGERITLSYVGLDNVTRQTHLAFSTRPRRVGPDVAEFDVALAPGASWDLFVDVAPELSALPSRFRFRSVLAQALWNARMKVRNGADVRSSDRHFNAWLTRSRADVALLTTEKRTGPFPYAGIPWFSTAFGRDGVITAMQRLWLDPELARGVLMYLAATQAAETSLFRDSQPGKILHETREGEMPALGEVPYAQYYGAVDTTPLYVILAAAYAERTADMVTIGKIWPALLAAIDWIDKYGDSDGDGFVDYAAGAASGLRNQGWKDSADSISHEDGTLAEGPIALIEVQGQVFAALRGIGDLAARRGDAGGAKHFHARAEDLRRRVEARFWQEDLGTYAIAIDGIGRACRVQSSNAGQLLASGLPAPDRAARVAANLRHATLDTGWGIRTLSNQAIRYNPMSYHNGSVWPHDTALCAAGLRRYGFRQDAVSLLDGMFAAAVRFDMRLPELFCGFSRAISESPIPYPVACLPQAWAAGTVFMLLQSCLGLRIDAWTGTVHLNDPALPAGVDEVTIDRLALGGSFAKLIIKRIGARIDATLTGEPGVVLVRT